MTYRIKRERGKWVLTYGSSREEFRSFKSASNRAGKLGASGGWTREKASGLVFIDRTREEVPSE